MGQMRHEANSVFTKIFLFQNYKQKMLRMVRIDVNNQSNASPKSCYRYSNEIVARYSAH